ncbi:MAG: L-seryl-tRNA(Sec) selenium transferase, partial [Micromonosporaceae bacterium]
SVLAALRSAAPAAEAALVVNNNAAALVLAATALAGGGEIVISRGELVEIGDGFRIPELLAATGARLREVGTTNRTSVADYADAIGPDTAMLLKVHPSNFTISGFTAVPAVPELTGLGVPLVVDIGSGLLRADPLLPDEPDAQTALLQGVALVTGSGDKLLGGPQAGVILGRRRYVDRLRRHPLARALRVDKLTLAALRATVAGPATPVHQALHAELDELRRRTAALVSELVGVDAVAVDSEATVGGGGAPGVVLPSAAVSLPAAYAEPLRHGVPAVAGRVARGRCLLDLRTVPPEQDAAVRDAVLAVAAGR